MKHRTSRRILGRSRSQRKALIKTLLGSLIMYERITTTEAKAKELKSFVDQVVNKAKAAHDVPERRVSLLRQLSQQIPAIALKKLSGAFVERFASRQSGHTRIVKIEPRKGDGARMAIIELV